MTSAHIENVHLEMLNKLLSDSVLECFRSPVESTETSSSSRASEEHGPAEAEEAHAPEIVAEEEQMPVVEESEHEPEPEIFPTPSLRLVLPDHIRVIEKHNRIHVLPEEFKTRIDPEQIPKIMTTPQQKYIDILADLTGCTKYKSSRAEFWFLDTLANLLRRAQKDGLDRPTQAILILWFCEWMKEMQHFDAADRKRMMRRFQDNMLAAARYIVEMDEIPTPAQAGVYYKAVDKPEVVPSINKNSTVMRLEPAASPATPRDTDSKSKVKFGSVGPYFECCIRDLAKIIHYIFDLFSTDYQYNLVRSIFTFTPEYSLIEAPHQIQNPKRMYGPLKPKKPEKSPKKVTSKEALKPVKGKKKAAEPPPAEYLDFLEKKAEAERLQNEQELLEMEQWNRKSTILPLGFAVTEQFFDKYWPPPPPPPPVVETSPPSKKGKKGKK